MAFGSRLPEIRVTPPGPASRAMSGRLGAVESRNVTFAGPTWPVFWDEAFGANVRDVDDNVYIDLTSAFGVALLGHRAPGVVRAVEEQAGRLVHGMGDIHPPARKLELLERLAGIAPWEDVRAILASTGSEVVEAALKTARLASGRPGILAFEGGYHGLTIGALATTDRDHFRAPFAERLFGGVAFAPFPGAGRGDSDGTSALAAVAEALRAGAPNGDAIGTIVIEPVQARGGCRVPPEGSLAALSDLAAEHRALVVADEIFTGLGRCGATFASERLGLRPDLICIGKALGGGLPISACLARRDVMDAWPESDGEAIHTSTFLGHPLACAAAIASLEIMERDAVAAASEALGARLMEGLSERLRGDRYTVRGLGSLIGIELVDASGDPAEGAAVSVAEAALRKGILVLPAGAEGHVVELAPPVCLTSDQVEHVIDVLGSVIEESV